MSRSRVTEFVTELEKGGFITIQRRGQGKTNIYSLRFAVKTTGDKSSQRLSDVGGPTSRSRRTDI
jgi:hypothetical protein